MPGLVFLDQQYEGIEMGRLDATLFRFVIEIGPHGLQGLFVLGFVEEGSYRSDIHLQPHNPATSMRSYSA